MWAITRADASHGLGDDFLGFFLRDGLARGVNFSKVFPQLVGNFQFPLMRNGRRLEGTNADCHAFLNAASQKGFDDGLLVGREIFGIADHRVGPSYIMTD